MWMTSEGERVLRGAEWLLFREGLGCLWDEVEEAFDDPEILSTGIESFDSLQPSQQLAMLALVGKALRDVGEPSPPLTAHSEGTIAAVFQWILLGVTFEVDNSDEPAFRDDPTNWRRLVLAACRETRCRKGRLPRATSKDLELWEELILEDLENRILWDDGDHDMAGAFLDLEPERARLKLAMCQIDEEYFTAIAPDPTDEELPAIRAVLRDLCESPERTG